MPHARPFFDVWQIDGKQKIAKFQIFHRPIVNPLYMSDRSGFCTPKPT